MSTNSTSTSIEANQHRLGLDAEARTYISRQANLFESMLPELLKDYSGQWVLFEDCHVIDADRNYQDLLVRVQKTMGDKIVLIKKVEPIIAHS
jgi:Family of unknown function (DUF5678)